jgi:hypothetical protein
MRGSGSCSLAVSSSSDSGIGRGQRRGNFAGEAAQGRVDVHLW